MSCYGTIHFEWLKFKLQLFNPIRRRNIILSRKGNTECEGRLSRSHAGRELRRSKVVGRREAVRVILIQILESEGRSKSR